jgi:hypothetical protein
MHKIIFILSLFSCLLLISASAAEPVVFYVSTSGSNSWSGTLPEPNAEGSDGPLATLTAARDKVRSLKWDQWGGSMQAPVEVQVRGGVYYESSTFQLFWYDSGSENYPVTYKAYDDEEPVFSGGKILPALTKASGENYYSATVAEAQDHKWLFRQLWIGGKRYTLAKSPNTGYYYVAGIPEKPDGLDEYLENYWQCHHFNFHDYDLKAWPGLSDGDINLQVFSLWEVQTVVLGSVTPASKEGYTESHVLWGLNPNEEITAGGIVKRYFVENAPDAMDASGEWYMDRNTGLLKVIPFADEDLSSMTAVAPVTQRALEVTGNPDADQFVEYVSLEGLAFRHYAAPPLGRGQSSGYRSNQGATNHPACVQIDGARHVNIIGCEISRNGTHGIQLGRGCTNNRIEKCHIYDVGAGGIYIGERVHTNAGYSPGDFGRTGSNTIHNNYIHHGGQVVQSGMGMIIGQSDGNTITNNEISYFKQSGVQIGWNWDTSASYSRDNNISFNHIHHIGLNISSDLGGIYTVGENLNTTVNNNHIHDIFCWMEGSGKGLYPDENTKGVTYQNNVVYEVGAYCLGVNYCRDITLRNNIFASAYGKAPFMFGHRADAKITNNIFYYYFGNPYSDNYDHISPSWFIECDNNIYWRQGGKPVLFQKPSPDGSTVTDRISFEQWKSETGFDSNSYVTDPMFTDPAKGDFSFKEDSPYAEIEFDPIDVSLAGLTGDKIWKSLPSQYNTEKSQPLFYEEFVSSTMNTRTVTFSKDGFASGFEYNVPGNRPKGAEVTGGTVKVSDDKARTGTYAVKAVSTGGEQAGFVYDMYDPIIYNGTVRISCDYYREASAAIEFAFTDSADRGEIVLDSEGNLKVGQTILASTQHGKWYKLNLTFNVGRSSDGKCRISLSDDSLTVCDEVVNMPFKPDSLETVSIRSLMGNSTFYIDNLVVKKIGGGAMSFGDDLRTDNSDYAVFVSDYDNWHDDVELFDGHFLVFDDLYSLAGNWLAYNPQIIAAAWDFAGGSGQLCHSNVLGGGDLNLTGEESWTDQGFLFSDTAFFSISKEASGNNLNFLKDFIVTATFKTTHTGTNTIWSRLNTVWEPGCKQFVVKNGKVFFDCGWVGTVPGNIIVNDGQWHTASVSYDKALNRIDIYVDGQLDVSSVLDIDLTSKPDNYDFFVGCQAELETGGRNAPFRGIIKDILIYN